MTELVRLTVSVYAGYGLGFVIDTIMPLYLYKKGYKLGPGQTALLTIGAATAVPTFLSLSGILERLKKAGLGLNAPLAASSLMTGMPNTVSNLNKFFTTGLQNYIQMRAEDNASSSTSGSN